jgi:hypothetical protein
MRESERISISKTWTEAQWDDAVEVERQIEAILGDKPSFSAADFVTLVIEERKLDPNTDVLAVLDLVILLGTESLFSIRHEALRRMGCIVSPDVAELAKARRGKKAQQHTRRVRGV